MIILTPKVPIRSGGRETAGPSDKDMVCCNCYRMFVACESSWAAAERKGCPYCGSKDTTPMLGVYYDAIPVLVKGPDGGYV